MGLVFRLQDYAAYAERVGGATYVDVTRRTDPARIAQVWDNLRAVLEAYGPPSIVQLWTKDAAGALARGGPFLQQLAEAGTTLTAQVTVTGLGRTVWEPGTPEEPFSGVPSLIALVGGPGHLKWRYDPILPTVHRPERFRSLAERAADLGIRRCVVNLVSPPGRYKRVDGRLAGVLPGWAEGLAGYDGSAEGPYGATWKIETVTELVDIGAEFGLSLETCAESAWLTERVPGLEPAACGDHGWFVALSGRDPGRAPASGSRPGCGCAGYFDVGLYGQWARCHRCLYCYAG